MCTAATYQTKHFYFGRNLDYEQSFGESVVITPRNWPLALRHGAPSAFGAGRICPATMP